MDGRENFLFLIEKYPSLMNLVGAEGRGALHSAATQEWPGYATELLNRGADRYARANDRATPFIWAVMRNASLEVADLLAEDANMDEILGPDIQSGFTAFGKVSSAMTSYKMDIGMNRLKYLVDKFGRPSFFVNVPEKTTVFRLILLQRTPLTDHAQIALEGAILKFLLDIFSDKIDFIDFTGRAPLHYAVHYGNLSATKILVDHGASVNTEMEAVSSDHPMTEGRNPLGYTALDLAIWNKKKGPDNEVLEGGAREIEQWQRNNQNIINLLIRSGGKSGSGSGWGLLEVGIETGELSSLVISRCKSQSSLIHVNLKLTTKQLGSYTEEIGSRTESGPRGCRGKAPIQTRLPLRHQMMKIIQMLRL
jgi:ankyrin repeat protein